MHHLPRVAVRRATAVAVIAFAAAAQQQAPPEERTETWPDGAVKCRYTVDADGNKHGRLEEFAANGTRTLLANYAHGRRDGECREWREDGTRLRVVAFRGDVLNGHAEEFHADGRTAATGEYRAGNRHGKWTETDADGARKRVAEYRAGLLHGAVRITLRDKVLTRQTWKDGDLVQLDDLPPLPCAAQPLRRDLQSIVTAKPAALDAADPLAGERAAAVRRLAAYRRLCGLPFADLTLVREWNVRCDAAAEVCRLLGHLDHHPEKPAGMDDARYRLGAEGAGNSNLAVGSSLERSVDQYLDDSDASNIDRIGHRRWCLNPALQKVGFGHDGGYSAMWSMDQSGGAPRGLDVVRYPPHGYTPVDLFGPRRAFSIGLRKGGAPKAADLKVVVQPLDGDWLPAGEPLPLDWCAPAAGDFGGIPCLVFRPVGIVVEPGHRYLVEVSTDGGKTQQWRYLVAFTDAIGGEVK